MAEKNDLIQEVISGAFNNAVKSIVEAAFSDRWGYADGVHITSALKAAATDMLKNDADVQAKLKKRMLELIEKGVSERRRS